MISSLAAALLEAGIPASLPPKPKPAKPQAEPKPPRKPAAYIEDDFQREVSRWALRYQDEKKPENRYDGPGWDYVRLIDQPRLHTGTASSDKKPYDCRFTCPRLHPSGVTIAESHALELKVCKAGTFSFAHVRPHQWEALLQAEAQGVNAFGWVVVCFAALDTKRRWQLQPYAARVVWLQAMLDRGVKSLPLDWFQRHGVRLRLVECHPWKTTPRARFGWDLTPLVHGKPNA